MHIIHVQHTLTHTESVLQSGNFYSVVLVADSPRNVCAHIIRKINFDFRFLRAFQIIVDACLFLPAYVIRIGNFAIKMSSAMKNIGICLREIDCTYMDAKVSSYNKR